MKIDPLKEDALIINSTGIGTTAQVEIGTIEEIDYLLVKRYDRRLISAPAEPVRLERLHQEDFCQALGIVSETKYENEGGPSLKKCFALLREVSEAPVIDLQRLLDAVIFNFSSVIMMPTARTSRFFTRQDHLWGNWHHFTMY
jgi:hypothetical protein